MHVILRNLLLPLIFYNTKYHVTYKKVEKISYMLK